MRISSFKLPRFVVPLAKLTAVPILLWIIVRNAVFDVGVEGFAADVSLIVFALTVNQTALFVFAVRMHMVLGIFGISISRFQAQRIHLQSIFYYYALPMTIGLEIARYAKIKTLCGDVRPITLTSALLADRIIGVLAAAAISGMLLPFTSFHTAARGELGNVAMLFGLCAVLALGAWPFRKDVVRYSQKVMASIRVFKRRIWAVFMVSLLTHLLFATGVFAGGQAVSLQVSFVQTLFVVAASMLFAIFPISFAGISPVEAASFGLLVAMGLPEKQAIAFAVIVYSTKLIPAIEGAFLEFVDGGRGLALHLDTGRRTTISRTGNADQGD